MAEYIKREALEIDLNGRLYFLAELNGEYDQYTMGFFEAVTRVKNFPSADVAPVRHGRWELYGNDDDLSASFFCSLCGWNMDEDEYLDRWSHLNYCPNCGAKMDEVNE